jgi:hypothetical protein
MAALVFVFPAIFRVQMWRNSVHARRVSLKIRLFFPSHPAPAFDRHRPNSGVGPDLPPFIMRVWRNWQTHQI